MWQLHPEFCAFHFLNSPLVHLLLFISRSTRHPLPGESQEPLTTSRHMLTSGLGSAVSGMASSVISSPRTQISELLTPQAAPQPLPYCLFLLLDTSASSKANSGVSFSWKHLLNPSLSFQDESPSLRTVSSPSLCWAHCSALQPDPHAFLPDPLQGCWVWVQLLGPLFWPLGSCVCVCVCVCVHACVLELRVCVCASLYPK